MLFNCFHLFNDKASITSKYNSFKRFSMYITSFLVSTSFYSPYDCNNIHCSVTYLAVLMLSKCISLYGIILDTVFRQWLEYTYNGSLTLLRVASRRSCAPGFNDIIFNLFFIYIYSFVHLSIHLTVMYPLVVFLSM